MLGVVGGVHPYAAPPPLTGHGDGDPWVVGRDKRQRRAGEVPTPVTPPHVPDVAGPG